MAYVGRIPSKGIKMDETVAAKMGIFVLNSIFWSWIYKVKVNVISACSLIFWQFMTNNFFFSEMRIDNPIRTWDQNSRMAVAEIMAILSSK